MLAVDLKQLWCPVSVFLILQMTAVIFAHLVLLLQWTADSICYTEFPTIPIFVEVSRFKPYFNCAVRQWKFRFSNFCESCSPSGAKFVELCCACV